MIRVKDPEGHVVKGVFKTPHGALVVNDPTGYDKYKRQQEAINNINQRIDQLTGIILKLQATIEAGK
jgi:hypothetical protein